MKRNSFNILVFPSVLLMFFMLIVTGCGQKAQQSRTSTGSMDTPAFHIQRGDEALLDQRYENARRSYRKALDLAPENSRALSGLAVASAYEASRPGVSSVTQEKVFEESKEQLEQALDNAENDEQKVRVHSFTIQMYITLQLPREEWYENAIEHFEDAVSLNPDNPEPYFFMGRAEARRLNYENATRMFHRVLSIGTRYEEEADRELKRIQDVQRAMPGSQFGSKIANVEKITRADVAALFVAELRLDRLYKPESMESSSGYKAPKSQQKLDLSPAQRYPEAVDIANHPLEGAIKEVIRLGVKGLSPDPAHKFHPEKEMTRAEFAQLLQDLLIRITGNKSLATEYVGQDSPFPDVSENVWYYNAIRTVVNRGLMTPDNKATGAFAPKKPVSGADALLAIRNLKEILKSYLR